MSKPPAPSRSSRRRAVASLAAIAARLLCAVAAVGSAATAGGCRPASDVQAAGQGDPGAIEVVATVGMVADLVRNVGGTHVRVTQLMGAGVDPHLYKVTRDDVRAIFAGDLIFYCGLMLEGKMAHTLQQMARRKPVIGVAEQLPPDRLLGSSEPGHAEAPDPHVWMDVALWTEALGVVTTALSEHAPEHAEAFAANAQRYREQMLALHRYGTEVLGSIPPQRRQLVTSHDAFGYFGRAYGLEVRGVQGLATDSEAGLMRINRLVDSIVQRRIAAVFVESSVPRKSIEAVIDGARAQGHTVVIGGELYSDSGGPAGTYEGTYIGMMDHNFTLIGRALGGSAPAGGFSGQLQHGFQTAEESWGE